MPRPRPLSAERRREIVEYVTRETGVPPEHLEEEGWDSVVAIAGDTVFRFPRGDWALERIRGEVAFLREFAPTSPIGVPTPELVEDPLHSRYELISGTPLLPGRLETWSEQEQLAAAESLGTFLDVLHGFPTARAASMGVPRSAWEEAWWESGTFADEVVALLDGNGRRVARRVLEAADPQRLNPPREVVVHNDLGPDHILVAERRITGIIDFGDMAIGDPALDFQWSVIYGPGGIRPNRLLEKALEFYTHDIDRDFFERVSIYRVYHGLRHVRDEFEFGDARALRAAITTFERAASGLL